MLYIFESNSANVCCSLNVRRQHILTLPYRLPSGGILMPYCVMGKGIHILPCQRVLSRCTIRKAFCYKRKKAAEAQFDQQLTLWSAVCPANDGGGCGLGVVWFTKTGEVWNPTKRQTRMLTRDPVRHTHTHTNPNTQHPNHHSGLGKWLTNWAPMEKFIFRLASYDYDG